MQEPSRPSAAAGALALCVIIFVIAAIIGVASIDYNRGSDRVVALSFTIALMAFIGGMAAFSKYSEDRDD